ncbi:MAG: beta strand repeat-containing protein, partial [Croceibacterium sp.]
MPDGTATFGPTLGLPNPVSITFSSNTSIQSMLFSLGSGAIYSFALPANVLTVGGSGSVQGVTIDIESTGPTFTQSLDGGLVFRGSATASNSFSQSNLATTKTGTIIVNTDTGFTRFTETSTAGFALIRNSNNPFTLNAGTRFSDFSTAGSARIENTNGGVTNFLDQSNAGNATIVNDNFGSTAFQGNSPSFIFGASASAASILNSNNGATFFNEKSTAESATIVNQTGGFTIFTDTATSRSATITNQSAGGAPGVTEFRGHSSAGLNSITQITNIDGGITNFRGDSTASFANITNGVQLAVFSPGTLSFFDKSMADHASITNLNGGQTNFHDSSQANFAHIINGAGGGQITFRDKSSAGNATIINLGNGTLDFFNTSTADHASVDNQGSVIFHDSSTLGLATITNSNGGTLQCIDQSVCDAPAIISAVIINNNGGSTFFKDQSTAGFTRLINNAGGVVDISGLTTAGMTAGSIEGAGIYFLGSKSLTVGGNNFSTEVSGVIADGGASGGAGGSLVKVGSGALLLSGVSTYTGATTLNEGVLIVNGSIAASSGLDVNAGTFLGGTGTLPTTRINAGGTLSPGNSIGTIAVAGNLSFAPGSFYVVEVSPTSSDRTVVNGTATLKGTVLSSFQIAGGFQKNYTILSAAGGVSGTFDALATAGLPTFVTASLGYTPNLVSLNLTLGLSLLPGLNGNQAQVAAGIDNSFNAGNAITGGFAKLLALPPSSLPGALTQLSGEAATGAQQTAFRLSDQFLGLMLDPFVDGRSGTGGADRPALGFAPEREALPDDIALAYAAVLKAPPMKAPSFEQRWTAWGGAFGGGSRLSGDPAV